MKKRSVNKSKEAVALKEWLDKLETGGGVKASVLRALYTVVKAVETMQMGVTITDTDGIIVYTNPAEAQMHGYQVDELIGKDIKMLSPKEIWQPIAQERIAGVKRWERESVNVKRDGTIFPVRLMSDLILDVEGAPMGIVTTCEDISTQKNSEEVKLLIQISEERARAVEIADRERANEVAVRRQAQAELREAYHTLEALIQASPLAIIVLNADESVKLWNPAAQRIFGWNEAEVVGQPLPIFPDEQRAEFSAFQSQDKIQAFMGVKTMQARLDNTMETRRRRRDGSPVDVSISVAPLFDASGNMSGTMAIMADITEHKHAEEQLKRSQEELRALSSRLQTLQEEERTKIAREIHDELGQSLTALKIDLSWLNQRLSAEQQGLRAKIASMSELIDTTIQSVRRISSELRPHVLDDLGLVAAIEWAVREFQARTEIECNLTIEPEAISLAAALSTAIFRILQEALTNVARHANATKVDIIFRKRFNELYLEVCDNGIGISEAAITDTRSLGLIGIKERALLWGGTVNIRSGGGTQISVRMPLIGQGVMEKI